MKIIIAKNTMTAKLMKEDKICLIFIFMLNSLYDYPFILNEYS